MYFEKQVPNSEAPAFPANSRVQDCGGLTKREYYAGLAMQGRMANSEDAPKTDFEAAAKACVKMADALIAELEK